MIRMCKEELIEVYDGLVPPSLQAQAYDLMRKIGFSTTEKDYPSQDDKLMALSAPLEMEEGGIIHQLAMIISKKIANNDDYYLERVYANCCTPADAPEPHQDSIAHDGLTIIYYPNSEWTWADGGETVFFKEQEIIYSVLPKPGRFVVFDSFVHHCARVQNVRGPKYRYTIVIKLRLNI